MRKYKLISALAEETATEVVRNEESWRRYLNTASRLYKYPFKEQLLIYAQRPDATACASIEIWNEKMHCWVNKGAKGIALIDEDSFSGLKYVFDISDVNKARRIGRFPNLWEMRDEHIEAVISRLEKTYGDTDKEAGFVGRIQEIAGRIAEDCYKELDKLAEYKPLAKVEELTEQNYNMIDNVLNNGAEKKEQEQTKGRISIKEKLAEKKAVIEQRDKAERTSPEKETEKKSQREM